MKEKWRQLDYVVLFCVLGMTALSIVVLAGASNKIGTRYAIVQSVAAFLGICVMFVFAYIDYDKLVKRFGIWIFVLAILAMAAVIVFGKGNRGNRSWLRIPGVPFDIQPSEYVKFLFIITYSRHIKRVQDNINHIKNVAGLAIHGGIIFGLVLMTGDLGSALVYLGIIAVMLLVGGLSIWYFVGVFALLIAASPFLWKLLSEIQRNRIIFGFNPELDPIKVGFQALHSRSAIAAGGFLGSGFSGGTQFKAIPDCYSDFIFAILAEKFGFFGCFLYIVLMTILVIRLIWIARIARKDYGAYICAGVVAVLMFQTLENIGMCLAMLPVIGITLPFMSYGGSSMLTMYMLIGLVQSIKCHNQKYFFEREKA
ncbi:MAG: FtsW/RodA/SpoVE family cell cycle protein [Clostridiales bacterium]|nr:FtsW/RodA/SpoVE family cell cycle protein [Clostridiales bacterium]